MSPPRRRGPISPVKATRFEVRTVVLHDVVRVDTLENNDTEEYFVGRVPSVLAGKDVAKAMTEYLKNNPEDRAVKIEEVNELEVH